MSRFVHEIKSGLGVYLAGDGACVVLSPTYLPGIRAVVRKVVRSHVCCCTSALPSCGFFRGTHRGGDGWTWVVSTAVSPDQKGHPALGHTCLIFDSSTVFPDPAPIATADHVSILRTRGSRGFLFWWGVADAGGRGLLLGSPRFFERLLEPRYPPAR